MPQYPLPALDVRTQQSDPLEQVGKVLSLQNMMRQSQFQPQLQAEQLKATQLENTGREQENTVRARQMQDDQTIMETLGKYNGDIDAALPELGSKVSPARFMGLKKYQLDVKQKIAAINKDELPVLQDQNNRLQGLIQQVSQLPDDQYIQQWPQIAAAAKEIKPDLKMDLSQPIPKQQLAIFGLQSLTLGNAIEKQKAADDAKAAAAKLPGEIANSQKAVKVNAGTNALGLTAAEQSAAQLGAGRLAEERRHNAATEGVIDVNNPQTQQIAAAVAKGDMKIQDVLTYRTPLPQRQAFLSLVQQINPQFSSADYDIQKGVSKAFTTGKPAEELVAFNTAIAHADLLKKAADQLQNGEWRSKNSVFNKFKTEFGFAGPPNYQTIANAYTREVTKALSAGHLTDAEISSQGATIPANASPEQINGVIDAYKQLMASKVQQRKAQYDAGRKAQPNFGTQQPAAEVSASGPNGEKIVLRNGTWVDAKTGAPIK
jgi:hypothetical protein